mgnify:CR=1 FL=1
MAVIELGTFDLFAIPAQRLYMLQPFWASLAHLGAPAARLLIVTDHFDFDVAIRGFGKVAVAEQELPHHLRWYRSYNERYLQETVRKTQYIRVFFIVKANLDDRALIKLINGYGIEAYSVDDRGIPLPFASASPQWDICQDETGKWWGVVQSQFEQTGGVVPQALHRLFSLPFPTYVSIDIWNYSKQEAAQMLKMKAAVAGVVSSSLKTNRDQNQQAGETYQAVDFFRQEMGGVGVMLHEMRLSVAVGAESPQALNEQLELVRGACDIDLERRRAQISVIKEMFSAKPNLARNGTLITSKHATILTSSALSYARPTETEGVLAGFDSAQSPVVINLFDPRNSAYNAVVVGQTGRGKTFFTSMLMARSVLTGHRLIIIDPKGDIDFSWMGQDDNGNELCQTVRVGTADSAINILEPFFDELNNQMEFTMSGLRQLGIFRPNETGKIAVLDMALYALYDKWGTAEQQTPTMRSLSQKVTEIRDRYGMETDVGRDAEALRFQLIRFAEGSRAYLFGQPTNIDLRLNAAINIFDVSAFPPQESAPEMRTMLFATLFGLINQSIKRRRELGDRAYIQFFIDEIGVLMLDKVVAKFVSTKYKTARSSGVAMIVVDQTVSSLLGPADEQGVHHGKEMFANALYRFVFHQEGSEMETIESQFPLMPEIYKSQIFNQPRGQCIAQTPQGVHKIFVTPSDIENIVLSSNLAHKARAKELIRQMRQELNG